MGLFKKKEPREIKDDDSLIVKLWYGEKTHALMVLGLWAIFFVFLFIALSASPSAPVENKSLNETSTKDYKAEVKNLFSYFSDKKLYNRYNITTTHNYFVMAHYSDNVLSGTMNIDDKIYFFIKDDFSCSLHEYQSNNKKKNNITPCPEEINFDYFYLDKILNKIVDFNPKASKEDEQIIYKYDNISDNLVIKLYTSNDILNKIYIKEFNNIYEITLIIDDDLGIE